MRRLLYVPGVVLIAWGAYGLMTAARHPRPLPWLSFFVGSALLNDLLLAPLVIGVGVLAVRLVGQSLRPYLTSGLIISAVISLVAFPLVAGYGRRSDNPSIQPLDYSRGLLATLAAVWFGVVVIALVRRLTRSADGRQLVR